MYSLRVKKINYMQEEPNSTAVSTKLKSLNNGKKILKNENIRNHLIFHVATLCFSNIFDFVANSLNIFK